MFDRDSSSDQVLALLRLPGAKDLTRLLVSKGLELWFAQCDPKEFARSVERKAKEVVKLPKPLYNEIAGIAQSPDAYRGRRSRAPALAAVIGRVCDGYRIDPLFALPGARELVVEVAERCATRLDRTLAVKKKAALPDDQLLELGVLVEFTNVGVYQTPERVEAWKKGFDHMKAMPTPDRAAWDGFCKRVEKAFVLLVAPTS
jgi:hypothetical protein